MSSAETQLLSSAALTCPGSVERRMLRRLRFRPRPLLVADRRQVAGGGVPAARVVSALDVAEGRHAGPGPGDGARGPRDGAVNPCSPCSDDAPVLAPSTSLPVLALRAARGSAPLRGRLRRRFDLLRAAAARSAWSERGNGPPAEPRNSMWFDPERTYAPVLEVEEAGRAAAGEPSGDRTFSRCVNQMGNSGLGFSFLGCRAGFLAIRAGLHFSPHRWPFRIMPARTSNHH